MAYWLLAIVFAYFMVLLFVAWRTSRNASNDTFFIGNRNSKWALVAFGMIGTSLSGATFISVPGQVGKFAADGSFNGLTYFQVVFGFSLGYFVVAAVLLPLYYRMKLTSIYNYLQHRMGNVSYKTGALFFIISRTVGATARLYLVINVLQVFLLDGLHIPFIVTTLVILLMILLYTFEGGVKTIVWTDTLQTTFMLLGLVICVGFILHHLHIDLGGALAGMRAQGYTNVVNSDVHSKGFFLKQVLGGAFITIGMTGLDQEMMQKNISVHNVGDSKKNMITFSFILIVVNALFLLLGGLLYLYAFSKGAVYQGHDLVVKDAAGVAHNIIGDEMFPYIALNYLPPVISIIFIIGLISALFPSADGALTALTSSFCIDLLGLKERTNLTERQKRRTRLTVHLGFALLFLVCIAVFKWINNKSIILVILDLAGYTYGPLLGLFAFGILTTRTVRDNWMVPAVCLLSPVLCYFLSVHSAQWFHGYEIGYELLIINGLFTFIGLLALSRRRVGL